MKKFWDLIEHSKSAKETTDDNDGQIVALIEALSTASVDEIVDFELKVRQELVNLELGSIMDLCIMLENEFYLVNGLPDFDNLISDEGFVYFRCWLVLQGKDFLDKIKKNIEAIVDIHVDIANTWGEGLLYVAEDAYSLKHENKDENFIELAADKKEDDLGIVYNEDLHGTEAKFDDLAIHYPKIARRIVEIKDALD